MKYVWSWRRLPFFKVELHMDPQTPLDPKSGFSRAPPVPRFRRLRPEPSLGHAAHLWCFDGGVPRFHRRRPRRTIACYWVHSGGWRRGGCGEKRSEARSFYMEFKMEFAIMHSRRIQRSSNKSLRQLGIWWKLFSGKIKCLARYLPNTRNDWGTSHSNGNFYVILAGNLFSLKQDLVVSCSRLCEIGPRCILSFYWTVKLVQIVLISTH